MTIVGAMKSDHERILREYHQVGPVASAADNDAFFAALLGHFAREERELYPVVQATGWTGGSAVTELRYQHQTLSQMFKASLQDSETWDRFGRQLQEHFSAEELLVFPLLEED